MQIDYLRYIDIFAQPIGLNIGGQPVYRTLTGSILSMVYFMTIILIIIKEVITYRDRSSPTLSTKDLTSQAAFHVDLHEYGLLPFFVSMYSNTEWIAVEDVGMFFTLRAQRISVLSRASDGEVQINRIFKQFSVVPCRELSDEDLSPYLYVLSNEAILSIFTNNGMCVRVGGELTIQGRGADFLSESFRFDVKACSLINPEENCAGGGDMDRVAFKFIYPSISLDNSNQSTPLKILPTADISYTVVPAIRQILTLVIKKADVLDNTGLLGDVRLTATSFSLEEGATTMANRYDSQISCPVENAFGPEGSECTSYFTLSIISGGDRVEYNRKYTTVSDSVGSIGGINGVVMILFTLLYSHINTNKRTQYIIEKVFPVLDTESIKQYDFLKQQSNVESKTRIPLWRRIFCCKCRENSEAQKQAKKH